MIYILLSAYKCTKYIQEQIDSILNQDEIQDNVCIWIRVDGSPDDSLQVLSDLYGDNRHIHIYSGENKGYAKSFMELVLNAPDDGDYYAFCDQDDVWKKDKLKNAISILKKQSIPFAYCAQPDYVDANLNPVSAHGGVWAKLPYGDVDVRSSVFTGISGLGCTFVWNQKFHKIFKSIPTECINELPHGHDNLISVLSTLVGGLYRDEKKVLLYRQHGSNTAGDKLKKKSYKDILLKRIKNWGGSKSYLLREYIYRYYSNYIDDDKLELLRLSISYNKRVTDKIKFLIKGYPRDLSPFFKRKFIITVLLNQY